MACPEDIAQLELMNQALGDRLEVEKYELMACQEDLRRSEELRHELLQDYASKFGEERDDLQREIDALKVELEMQHASSADVYQRWATDVDLLEGQIEALKLDAEQTRQKSADLLQGDLSVVDREQKRLLEHPSEPAAEPDQLDDILEHSADGVAS
eukprot:GEMP01058528.1.p1 GENE.GEMP01058528.1~~GEMP01058528.1.p1  ORF type:complete len:156 (+),score=52.49 GEMP01058528.1:237-704(+)